MAPTAEILKIKKAPTKKINDALYDTPYFYETTYVLLSFFSLISKIFLALFIIGVLYIDYTSTYRSEFMKILFFVKIFVGVLLIYRFTSHRDKALVFTDLDRKIAYSAGIFILVVSLSDEILKYSEAIHAWAFPFTSSFVAGLFGTTNPTAAAVVAPPVAAAVVPSPTSSSLTPSSLDK
jgi:hypothetical protein